MAIDQHPSPRKATAGKPEKVSDDQVVDLVEKLKAYPHLREKLTEVLDAADNKGGVVEADAAEELIVGLMRDVGKLTLQTWADNQVTRQTKEFKEAHPNARNKGKKN